jgi:hypothetical protein
MLEPCDVCQKPTTGRDAVFFHMKDGVPLDPPQEGSVPLCDDCRLCPICEDFMDACECFKES